MLTKQMKRRNLKSMKTKNFLLFICILFMFNLYAQEKKDALKLYREGRAFELANNLTTANALYKESSDVCRSEIQANSRSVESYVVLGWSLLRLRQYRETVTISEQALKIAPKEYRIIETLGEAYFYLDNYTESLKQFENYLAGLPNGERASSALFFVGEIYRLRNRPEHADIAYCAALHRDPQISLWWYRLGKVRESANNKQGAKAAYERALKLKPDYVEAQEAIKRVS